MNFQPPPSKFQAYFFRVGSETYKDGLVFKTIEASRWFLAIEMRHRSMVMVGCFGRFLDGFESKIGHFWSFLVGF